MLTSDILYRIQPSITKVAEYETRRVVSNNNRQQQTCDYSGIAL